MALRERPWQDSNLQPLFRKPVRYPLCYKGFRATGRNRTIYCGATIHRVPVTPQLPWVGLLPDAEAEGFEPPAAREAAAR